MNEKILEFFKDPSKYIKRLLQESLDEKWYEGSMSMLFTPCSFCDDVYSRMPFRSPDVDVCDTCFCPPEICCVGGDDGYISILVDKCVLGTRATIRYLSEPEFHRMLTLFKNRLDNLDCLE